MVQVSQALAGGARQLNGAGKREAEQIERLGAEPPWRHVELAAFAERRKALDPAMSAPDERVLDFMPRHPRNLPKLPQYDPPTVTVGNSRSATMFALEPASRNRMHRNGGAGSVSKVLEVAPRFADLLEPSDGEGEGR